jgi:hypothetical protein
MATAAALPDEAVSDLHEIEVELLLTLADFVEEHDRPMLFDQLLVASGLEHAHFVRRLRYLVDLGLVRAARTRPLAEPDRCVELTGSGTLRVIAERAVARATPTPGARSRLSPLAEGAARAGRSRPTDA